QLLTSLPLNNFVHAPPCAAATGTWLRPAMLATTRTIRNVTVRMDAPLNCEVGIISDSENVAGGLTYGPAHPESAKRKARRMRFARILFSSVVAALGVVSAYAQGAPDFSKVEIKANRVTDKFYTLDGQGGTIGVLFGPDGVFMVDTQF